MRCWIINSRHTRTWTFATFILQTTADNNHITVAASFIANLIIALGCIYASILMHTILLTNVMRWPMETFDQTPVGRILNRFSKEIEVVDTTLPLNLRSWLTQFFAVNLDLKAFKLSLELGVIKFAFIWLRLVKGTIYVIALLWLCNSFHLPRFKVRDANWLWLRDDETTRRSSIDS